MSDPILTAQRVRMALNVGVITNAVQQGSGAAPIIGKGFDVQFDFVCGLSVNNAFALADISKLAQATLQIWQSSAAPIIIKTITSFDLTATLADWQAVAKQHFSLTLSAADTNQAAGDYTVALYGVTDDSPAKDIMLGTFTLTIKDYGVRGTDQTTPPPGPGYTQSETDARFVPSHADQARARWNGTNWEYYFSGDAKWREMIPTLVDGDPVTAWGEPKD